MEITTINKYQYNTLPYYYFTNGKFTSKLEGLKIIYEEKNSNLVVSKGDVLLKIWCDKGSLKVYFQDLPYSYKGNIIEFKKGIPSLWQIIFEKSDPFAKVYVEWEKYETNLYNFNEISEKKVDFNSF